MSARLPALPVGAALALGFLAGGLLVLAVPSPALVVLAATLLTAAALAPVVAGMEEADWAGRLVAALSERGASVLPALRLRSGHDRRRRTFAALAGLNLAVFAAFAARAVGG